jgi:hypothetical protein
MPDTAEFCRFRLYQQVDICLATGSGYPVPKSSSCPEYDLMPRIDLSVIAAACAAMLIMTSAALAVERKTRSVATPERNIFDLGNVAATTPGYNYARQGSYSSQPYSNIGEFYGSGTLPEGRSGGR